MYAKRLGSDFAMEGVMVDCRINFYCMTDVLYDSEVNSAVSLQ